MATSTGCFRNLSFRDVKTHSSGGQREQKLSFQGAAEWEVDGVGFRDSRKAVAAAA